MVAPAKKSSNGKRNDSTKAFKPSKKPFKKTTDDVAARSEAMALQLEEAADFPRGGGTSLSKKELEKIHEDVDAKFRVNEHGSKNKKGGKSKKKIPTDVDESGILSSGLTGKPPRYANKITIKNISPGMKLLGVVAEVNQKDIVISLPGGLRGLVRASEAADFADLGTEEDENELLGDIFHVGQLVPCIVLQLDDDKKEAGKRKIWLSLRLSLLHNGLSLDSFQPGMMFTASVKSVEDHGCILHFGLPSVTGFIEISNDGNQESGVKTGQLIQGVVTKIDKDRKIVHLSSDPDSVAKCVTKDLNGMSFDLLNPGMMVNARVESVLENGIFLSFLTYFPGTVDLFHLQNPLCNKSWKDEYSKKKTVNARILFIDPSSRAIGLTLNPHLVSNKAPPLHVSSGDIFDEVKVVRVDKSGILLELPSKPLSTPAYVSTYDVAGDEVKKPEKFKEGNRIRVRILGLKQMEGLAIGTLKASAFEGPVFTHSDVKLGMVTKAKVISVDPYGAIVQFPGGLKAMCPLQHMSESEFPKTGKFKVGAELKFRVLGCKSKRITVTYKKQLVNSKLPILSSFADATEGLVTHGWITKIEKKKGCFVRFYNRVQGYVPRSELGLDAAMDPDHPDSGFHVGQVVKCRVTSSLPMSKKINLSFKIKPTSVSEDNSIKLGSIVSGVIDSITPQGVIVHVNSKGVQGTISAEHLADHHEQAKLMKSLLRPKYELDKLVVLDIERDNLVLSSKYSLIKLAEELPSDFSQVQPNSVVHGYVCNLNENGCFVRFLGRLTGLAPRRKGIDDPRAALSESFVVGQSVRANIVDVNQEKNKITLSLKQSSCASVDASFLQEYFLMDEKISTLQSSDITESECNWVEKFSIGSLIKGTIEEQNNLGVVVHFENINNVLGIIPQYHMGGATLEKGSVVHAVVLDLSRAERLVDLSLRPELIKNTTKEVSNSLSKKKRKRGTSKELEIHQKVSAVVEIVKDQYLVLSIPEHGYTIGYASVSDYNTQKLPAKQFSNGQSVVASVEALQNPLTSGRLLLLLDSNSGISETSRSKKAKKSSCEVGSIVQAEITEIKPFELRVNFGHNLRGRIYITEVNDGNTIEEPFAKFRVGQSMPARVVAKPSHTATKKSQLWELSVKPATLRDSSELNDVSEELEFVAGQCVSGYVYKVDKEWCWLAISRNVTARIFILDTACEARELEEFEKRFPIGKAVSGYVLTYNKEKKTVRLVQRPLLNISKSIDNGGGSKTDKPDSSTPCDDDATLFIHDGDILGGRISKILPGVGGLRVQIGPYVFGRVHFTEINDSWVSNPLDGFREGQFVKCKVLEVSSSSKGTWQIELSLRTSLDGMTSDHLSEAFNNDDTVCSDTVCKRFERIEDLSPNMGIQGYVKNTMAKGCFIMLSRTLDAKVLLSNLSDTFVEEPEKEFPVGKLVTGRVLNVEPLSKRIEVTLKTVNAGGQAKSESYDMKKFHVGDIISGRIKRVEPYGLFIAIGQTGMVGLCHKSELSDDRIDDVQTKYKAGESVTAKILKLVEEKRRISLGMKSSYFMNGDDVEMDPPSKENDNEASMECDPIKDPKSEVFPSVGDFGFKETIGEKGTSLALAQVESRASIAPLEVELDDEMEDSEFDKNQNQVKLVGGEKDEKSKRREKQKDKEEREKKIQAAEVRSLENHAPESADEFEKLVRSSPNSSFVWIKYMAFMLSLADIEKARSIAERALRTINIREEEEKLNIWVAYFNLENEHGNPPEEAVKKVFERARQYCDPKKVYFALLGVYERTEQYKLADKLLDEMIKKFKKSCKVWLRKVQSCLKQNEGDIQSIVNRALLCLDRHKHIKFISQTAILEYKCGVADRGRSQFEGVLREYPKRTDLWSVYLDQEIRLGDAEMIRSLFERAISLSLPPKKMKFLFKKFLEYEKSAGDEETVEYVKQRAMEYADSTLA